MIIQELSKIEEAAISDRWILADAESMIFAEAPNAYGIKATFKQGSQTDERKWAFIDVLKGEEALNNLRTHIGKEVVMMVEEPPSFMMIEFSDGWKWGVAPRGMDS